MNFRKAHKIWIEQCEAAQTAELVLDLRRPSII
jgi:hypothetical protein